MTLQTYSAHRNLFVFSITGLFSGLVKRVVCIYLLTLNVISLSAQTIIGNSVGDPSAILDIQSNSKGVLFPRMTAVQRNGIPNPLTGLMIWNTTDKVLEINLGTPNFPYWKIVTPRLCRAKINPTTFKIFKCHNLGAANTDADPFVPSWEIAGDYWQWGIRNVAADGPSGPDPGQDNSAAIAGWNSTGGPDNAWRDDIKTANDPCPDGFRVPTKADWDGMRYNNPRVAVGTFTDDVTNYGSGTKWGEDLFLPTTGQRGFTNGSLLFRGVRGTYWSSTQDPATTDRAYYFYITQVQLVIGTLPRGTGMSIRSIAE